MSYTELATVEQLNATVAALTVNHFQPEVVDTKEQALEKIREWIPSGASVMNGASKTLEEIGFIDYLKNGQHGWKNLHADILGESDKAKQSVLRQQALHAEYYLGSVHALTQEGEMLIASNTGSQLPHLTFTSANLILVVGSQKIVPNMMAAFDRLQRHVIPLEDARLQAAHGVHTQDSKTLLLHKENPMMGRKVRVLIIKEALGF